MLKVINKYIRLCQVVVLCFLNYSVNTSANGNCAANYSWRVNSQIIKVGDLAHNFSSFTPEGSRLSLKGVMAKGNLTLLEFWASWCGPCRTEIPNIKKCYTKYHKNGFNVLSVSIDQSQNAWTKAIYEENIPWPNVSDLKGLEGNAAKLYGIVGVPANFLIDERGKVIAKDIRGEELNMIVEEYFKKKKRK